MMLCFICFFYNLTIAQQHIIYSIIDSISGEKIPYATINIKNKGIYFEADSLGKFTYLPEKGDTILISCVGYFDKFVVGLRPEYSQIKLNQRPKELEGVYTGNYPVMSVGIFEEKVSKSMSPSLSDRTEYATLINVPLGVKKYSIQRIYFKVYTKHAKSGAANPVRIHVYKVNDNGSPGDDLQPRDIVLKSIKLEGKYLVIDLSEENMVMTDRSVFISMQWIKQQSETENYMQPQISFTEKGTVPMTWVRQMNLNNYNWFLPKNLKFWGNMIVKADIKVYE